MLKRVLNQREIKEIVTYLGDDYKRIPYMYVNAIKYGLGTEHVFTWIDYEDTDDIKGVYMLYYDCIHFYTKDVDTYPLEKLLDFISCTNHRVIIVPGAVGERISKKLEGYYYEQNHVIDMDWIDISGNDFRSVIATKDEIREIAELLIADPEYSNVYERDILIKQMLDRYDNGFSRYIIIKMDGKIVASCSTYGEVEGLAIISGVIVHPEYRRRGLARDVEIYACKVLEKEGKTRIGFVNYNNTASLALHEKLGAVNIGTLAKFVSELPG